MAEPEAHELDFDEKLNRIARDVAELVNDVRVLRTYVIDGNGKPSLLDRVTDIERNRPRDVATMNKLFKMVGTTNVKIDKFIRADQDRVITAAQAHVQQMEAIAIRKESETREKRGLWVAIALGLLGAIVSLLAALIPVYLGK